MSDSPTLFRRILDDAAAALLRGGRQVRQLETDLKDCGVAYYRINLAGELERLDPMKVRIRQPWDKPRE